MAWMFPDDAVRPGLLVAMSAFLAEHLYLPNGACVVDDRGGAALWQPPGAPGEDSESFLAEHGQAYAEAIGGQVEREQALGTALAGYRPSEPHWYLSAIGVRPSAHGQGIGGRLLAHTLRQVDAAGQAAFLEATTERSAALYASHGFEVIAEVRVEDSPPLRPMVRQARGARPESDSF